MVTVMLTSSLQCASVHLQFLQQLFSGRLNFLSPCWLRAERLTSHQPSTPPCACLPAGSSVALPHTEAIIVSLQVCTSCLMDYRQMRLCHEVNRVRKVRRGLIVTKNPGQTPRILPVLPKLNLHKQMGTNRMIRFFVYHRFPIPKLELHLFSHVEADLVTRQVIQAVRKVFSGAIKSNF